ncbi:histidine-rich glycoprotein [Drosophila grimshawi]|uniref:GH14924 n=1 Tax=Drosophila grimshawi TaxID=7222 RepID=B4J1Q8_DROGR|nr:histidine-rich glycoprotein [Drosophila grimshawi]EDV96978.1 GH14924 [Drosophila grimshawi]
MQQPQQQQQHLMQQQAHSYRCRYYIRGGNTDVDTDTQHARLAVCMIMYEDLNAEPGLELLPQFATRRDTTTMRSELQSQPFFICTLALLSVAQAGLLPHLEHDHHHEDLSHFVGADVHHSDGIHLGHSSSVVHDEPHHFLHYRNPVVDHHIIHNAHAHIDEHAHAHHADLHHYAHHSAPLVHHHHSAPLVHHHHSHAAVVHRAAYPAHLDVHSHANLLSFAKHHLHGKYGKVRITETHY